MKYVTGFLMKWVMLAAVTLIIFSGLYGADIGLVLLMSAILGLFTYLAGDLLMLPSMSDLALTIIDLVLAFFGLWLLSAIFLGPDFPDVVASAISAVLIAAGEWFFHIYMKRRVFGQLTA